MRMDFYVNSNKYLFQLLQSPTLRKIIFIYLFELNIQKYDFNKC